MLDFHSHLMPGVDDGAADIDESRSGLATMVEQGVRTIITTPHIRGSLTVRPRELDHYLGDLDKAFDALSTLATAEFPEIRLERGVEMMLDIPDPVLDDERLRLAGSRYALFEFPYMNIPPNSTLAIREVRAKGVVPVIAHPERYSNMSVNLDLVESWRDAGACIQVNCGSVVGQYGATAKRLSWRILENGWADFLSSDFHSRGRCSISAAAAALLERGGAAQHRALTVTNPQRMLRSEDLVPVDPLEEVQLGFWKKVFRG
jgi:protein-tyrosine phosphatase